MAACRERSGAAWGASDAGLRAGMGSIVRVPLTFVRHFRSPISVLGLRCDAVRHTVTVVSTHSETSHTPAEPPAVDASPAANSATAECCCTVDGSGPYCGEPECDFYYCQDCGNEFDEPCPRHEGIDHD